MADVDRDKITALWREAAAALEPGDYYRDPESGEYVYAADEPSAPKPCAECGRLREQLDALEAVADAAQAYLDAQEKQGPTMQTADLNPYSLRGRRAALRDALAARAALGVEGEQE